MTIEPTAIYSAATHKHPSKKNSVSAALEPLSASAMLNSDESMLKQWEQMHRPPDSIPTSGPHFTRAHAAVAAAANKDHDGTKNLGVLKTVPPNRSGGGGDVIVPTTAGAGTRRHSVISSSRDRVTSFPLKTNGFSSKGGKLEKGGKSDMRRPSEVWLGMAKSYIIVSICKGDK
jgi:hypothetical protein